MKTNIETSAFGAENAVRNDGRKREAEAMRKRLNAAIAAVDTLDLGWGIWADTVRQDAEVRHGVAYPVPLEEADAVLFDDPEYGTALDCGKALDQAKRALHDALASFSRIEEP